VTPDAVLHRYVELVSGERIDLDALYRVVTMDADLLGRWVASLGCPVEPEAIRASLRALAPDAVRGLMQGQLWGLAPLRSAARLGFDQWRTVLRASCLAESLAECIEYPAAEAARLRTLLGISGIGVRHDPLMVELAEFRGAAPLQLVDAHPLLRMFAVVEALEHQSEQAAADLAETLFRIEPPRFADLLREADAAADTLVQSARIRDEVGDRWRERLWLQAQIMAFSNLIAGETDSEGIHDVAGYVTRSLFTQIPRCFLFDPERGSLVGVGDDDLAALSISAMNSRSVIARALRERRLIEAEDVSNLPVSDRQIMRRLRADRICAVPMLYGDERIGVLVFRQSDDDRSEVFDAMQAYAAELARWLSARQRDEHLRRQLLDDYRNRHEKRLREIVHEANNPLSIINNYLHVLEMRLGDQEGAREQLRLIGDEIRRAASIIARAVEFPTPAAEEGVERGPVPRRFDLNELVRNVVELIAGQAAMQHVQVEQALFADGVFVVTDPDMVTQIVTNLVRNAVEAMPDGGTLTIETASGVYRQGHAGVEVVVRDNGPGIPESVLARLYEPKSSTKGGTHAGLGLHITAQLVERLNGAIDVRTLPERGTSFSVYLANLTAA
jgi:signal transduction histidine kinase